MSNTDLFLIQLNSFLLRVEQNTGFEIERGRYGVVSPPQVFLPSRGIIKASS